MSSRRIGDVRVNSGMKKSLTKTPHSRVASLQDLDLRFSQNLLSA